MKNLNQNPNFWLNSPFSVSASGGNNMVWIIDAKGSVVTEILPGAIHGVQDITASYETKVAIAKRMVDALNGKQPATSSQGETNRRYPWAETAVGESFFVPGAAVREGDSIKRAARNKRMKVTIQKAERQGKRGLLVTRTL